MPTMTEDVVKDGNLDLEAVNRLFDEHNAAEDTENKTASAEGKPGEGEDDAAQGADADRTDSGDGAQGEDEWLSQGGIPELIESLGLSQEDAAEFSGPEELQRFIRFHDRQLAESKPDDKAGDDKAGKPPRDESGQFAKDEEAPELNPEDYVGDEDLVAAINWQRNQITQLKEEIAQQREFRDLEEFNAQVDTLGHDDLFGKTGEVKEGTDAWKNRSKLWDAKKVLAEAFAKQGKQLSSESLTRRALNMEFAEQLFSKNRRSMTEKVKGGGKRRLGSGGQRVPLNKSGEWDGDLKEDPVLRDRYRKLIAENG